VLPRHATRTQAAAPTTADSPAAAAAEEATPKLWGGRFTGECSSQSGSPVTETIAFPRAAATLHDGSAPRSLPNAPGLMLMLCVPLHLLLQQARSTP
jgi:hypothetical protein